MRKTIIKRLFALTLIAALSLAPTLSASAMTKAQVNSEITKLKKRIKTDKKKYPSLLKADQKEASEYIEIQGHKVSDDPLIIFDPNKNLYMHFANADGLTFDDGGAGKTNAIVKVSDKSFLYGLWTCYDTTVAVMPHKASDLQSTIKSDQARLTLLQNSKKELLAIDGLTLSKGQSVQLTTHFSYNTQKINTLTWKSSNNKIVTVSKNGTVTGKKKGSAVISAKLSVTGKTYKTVVNVQ